MLIGINGFKRSGKGETGLAIQYLMDDRRFETTHLLGFADKLKALAAKSLGFIDLSDRECIELMDRCKEEWFFDILEKYPTPRHTDAFPALGMHRIHKLTGRQYLQWMGTEARKVFGEDFWVDQVLPAATSPNSGIDPNWRARAMYAKGYRTHHVAFTDLRFPNEAQRVLDLGGEVWEVLRPGTASDGHDSELVLPRELVTRQIDNSGDLANLRYEVEKALNL